MPKCFSETDLNLLYLQIHGLKYFYTIGGWNLDFLSSVDRLEINSGTGEPVTGAKWEPAPSLHNERSGDIHKPRGELRGRGLAKSHL